MNFLFIQIMAVVSEWRGWKHHDQYNNENNAVVYHFLQIMAPTYICMLSVILLAERLSSLTTAFHTGISTCVIALFKEGSKAIQDCISVALLCSMACWENLFNPLNQSDAKMKPLNYQWLWGGGGFPNFSTTLYKLRIVFFNFAFSYIHSSLYKLGNVLRQVNIKYFIIRSDKQSCGCNNFGVRQVYVVMKTDGKRGGVPLDPPMLCFYTLSSNTFWYYIYLFTDR